MKICTCSHGRGEHTKVKNGRGGCTKCTCAVYTPMKKNDVEVPLNMEIMQEICALPEKKFSKYAKPIGKYWFKDNGSNILAVGHLDTVQPFTHFDVVHFPGKPTLFTPVCDDRIGVYVILSLLPAMGIVTDILLTTDEESHNSSAKDFKTEKKYNWIVEFDREETDAVHYQYTDPDWLKAWRDAGFTVTRGMSSDIAYMENLGVCAMNVGTGYRRGHEVEAYCLLNDLVKNVRKFYGFWTANKDVVFPFTPAPPTTYGYYYSQPATKIWKDEEDEVDSHPITIATESIFYDEERDEFYTRVAGAGMRTLLRPSIIIYDNQKAVFVIIDDKRHPVVVIPAEKEMRCDQCHRIYRYRPNPALNLCSVCAPYDNYDAL